jgi:TonB-dependent starch-binding outer membrane protein SusC
MRIFYLFKIYDKKINRDLLKIILTMKIFVLLTFISVLNATASVYSQSEKITISLTDATVYEVLNTIEQQSKVKFFYQNEQIDGERKVSIDVKNQNIEAILDLIFNKNNVKIRLLGDNLVVLTKENKQQQQVSGTITSAKTGESLPGVNIIEKGTTNGVVSDLNGKYTIILQGENPVLVFSYLGYNSEERQVLNQTTIDMALTEDVTELEEIVIVGYGQVKKTDLTGSVSSLGDETLTERSVNNPMEALQGNVAGVQIKSTTGRLGDEFNISIRGKNSLNSDAKPLYIVDGVVSDGIEYLNPQDIARIDILKDASSTAIYGSRGSNGVIIVSTKSGSSAKKGASVSFDSYYGIKKPARFPKMMDAQAWWNYHKAAYMSSDPSTMRPGQLDTAVANISAAYPAPYGQNRYLLEAAANNETFDWYDAVLQNGMTANNYLSVSGEGENIAYNLGLGAQNETGLIAHESLDKYSIKAGFDGKITKMFSIGTNLTFTRSSEERGNDQAMLNAFRFSPLITPYDIDGVSYFIQPGKLVDEDGRYLVNKTSTWNPLLDIRNASDLTKRINVIGNTYAELRPLEWLSLKSTLSVSYDYKDRGQSWGALTEEGHNKGDLPVAQISQTTKYNYTWDNLVNINYTYNNDHNFSLLGLQSIYSATGKRTYQYADHMPFETGFYNLASGTQTSYLFYPSEPTFVDPTDLSNAGEGDDVREYYNLIPYYAKQTLASFALRLNYNYKEKYLLTLSNRWDGSSLLSEGNKWAAFPSGAVAWRISEEAFMKSQDIISNLKLRVSLGYTGNNVIPPYSSLNYLDHQTYYSLGSTTATGWLPLSLANSELTWEKTREFNVGIDFGLLKNRITGVIDIYNRLSDEILMEENLPLESGWESIRDNVGSISNKGVEIGLTTKNVSNQFIRWETSFIFSKNTNKIVSIHGQTENDDIGNDWFIGESIDAIYNYQFDGIVQADEAGIFGLSEGMAKVKDIDGDGSITADADRVILGSSDPDWTGSFYTKLTIANFDLTASIITNQGVLVYSPFHQDFLALEQRGRQKLDVSYYIPANNVGITPNFSNEYPRPRYEGTYWRDAEIGFLKDASFVKVKNISIGYRFPEELLSKAKIKSLRIYFNVIDPFVFTKYDGYDPEWAAASRELGRVASVTYQLGLNVKF